METADKLALIRLGMLAHKMHGAKGETVVVGPVPKRVHVLTTRNRGDLLGSDGMPGAFVRMELRKVELKKWLWPDGTSVWLGYDRATDTIVYSFDEALFPDEEGV